MLATQLVMLLGERYICLAFSLSKLVEPCWREWFGVSHEGIELSRDCRCEERIEPSFLILVLESFLCHEAQISALNRLMCMPFDHLGSRFGDKSRTKISTKPDRVARLET